MLIAANKTEELPNIEQIDKMENDKISNDSDTKSEGIKITSNLLEQDDNEFEESKYAENSNEDDEDESEFYYYDEKDYYESRVIGPKAYKNQKKSETTETENTEAYDEEGYEGKNTKAGGPQRPA